MTGSSREFYGTGTNFLRYRYRYFFPGPIFSGTGTGTFFRDLIFPVPVPVLFSGTKFFRYRYRYFFPGPILSGTDTGTIQKGAKFPGPGCHTLLLFCVLFICISYFVHLCLGRKLPYFCKIVNISIFFLRVFAFPLIFGEYWSE